MSKMSCSIIIVAFTFFTACKQNPKQESSINNAGINKTEAESENAFVAIKHNDSLLNSHAKADSKKLSCCVAPPSRFKIKADKK